MTNSHQVLLIKSTLLKPLFLSLTIYMCVCVCSRQILLAKETVAVIMMLYKNTKVKVRLPDGDTDFFDIVAGVRQGDTLAPYLLIICLDYMLQTSVDLTKENSFTLAKARSKRYPA